MVLAGPGTGKTRVIVYRVVSLIRRELAYPAEITIVTFTRKAAAEIRERIERLLDEDVADLTVATLDALAYAILYAESGNKPIKVADEMEAARLIGQAIEQVGLDPRVWTVRRLMADISRAKDVGARYPDVLVQGKGYDDPILACAALALEPGDALALTALVSAPSRGIDADALCKIRQGKDLITLEMLSDAMAPEAGLPAQVVENLYDLLVLVSEDLPKAGTLSPIQFVDWAIERTGHARWMTDAGRTRDLADHAQRVREIAGPCRTLSDFVHAMEGHTNQYRLAVGRVYRAYQQLLDKAGQIDFNDLAIRAIEVLKRDESIAAFHRARARFVLVDEFQDTSRSQYRLIRALTGPERNITVVGSPAQAIYTWRGADPDYLLDAFRKDFPDAREIVLQDHYRCTPQILAAASSVVNGRYPDAHGLVPQKGRGEPVVIGRFDTESRMADYVAGEIRRWRDAEPGRRWNECAVLYRANQQSDAIQSALVQAGIPYSLPQGQITMLERAEIRHLMAYTSLALDSSDELALTEIVNVPPRHIGAASLKKIRDGRDLVSLDALSRAMDPAVGLQPRTVEGILDLLTLICDELPQQAAALPPVSFLNWLLNRTGYDRWIAGDVDYYKKRFNVKWLLNRAEDYDSVVEFAQAIRAMESQQLETPRGVLLSTIHAVKGLEFPLVFIVGMDEGRLPHHQALKLRSDPEEERRLCYVGMTRAQERLYLLGSRTERVNGHYKRVPGSRYLVDVPTSVSRRI